MQKFKSILMIFVSLLLLLLSVGCSPTASPQNNTSREGVISVYLEK